MKPNWMAAISLILFVFNGCANQDQRPSISMDRPIEVSLLDEPPAQVTPLTVTRGPDATEAVIAHQLQPSPELAVAVSRGEARPAGPITDRAYQCWQTTADVRVRLEGQIGKRTHLIDLMKLAARNEDQFIDKFSLRDVHPGESADRQLRVFQLLRDRLEQEIKLTDQQIQQLRDELATLDINKPNTTFLGDEMMATTLSEFGLSDVQVAKLHRIEIRNVRDLALHFYLPQQHGVLAGLLGVDLPEAQRLVREAAKGIPEQELDELVRETHRPHGFGVLPPEFDTKGN